jgi:hypothetical protein
MNSHITSGMSGQPIGELPTKSRHPRRSSRTKYSSRPRALTLSRIPPCRSGISIGRHVEIAYSCEISNSRWKDGWDNSKDGVNCIAGERFPSRGYMDRRHIP